MRQVWAVVGFTLGLGLGVCHAQQALDPKLVQELKAATAYIKTEVGPLGFTGSGFVISNGPDGAFIVTNNHVIAKPKELEPNGYIPGLSKRDQATLRQVQAVMATIQPKVSVVFNSGESNELTVKAQVLAASEEPDLAVLGVPTIPFKVKPFTYESTPTLTETMPLFMLGFPFGETLSMNKGNPAATVGKGSVSSIRKNDLGRIVKVQIDGALNPGNSGGPVVDAQGKLLGIAVQTIQGSNIGLAIHPDELVRMMNGNLGSMTLVPHLNEAGKTAVELVASLNDPLKKLKGVSVHFVAQAIPFNAGLENQSQIAAVPGSKKLDLIPNGNQASVKLPMVLSVGQTSEITVQGSFVDSKGKRIFTPPQVLKVAALAPVSATETTPGQATAQKNNVPAPKMPSRPSRVAQNDKKSGKTKPKDSTTKDAASDGGFKPVAASNKLPGADKSDDDDEAMEGAEEGAAGGKVVWSNAIKKMIGSVPTAQVNGTLSGISFSPEKILFHQQRLSFRQVDGTNEIDVSLMLKKKKEELSNQRCVVNGKPRPKDPSVTMTVRREGDKTAKAKAYQDYLLVIEFGKFDDDTRTLPGKIYLCFPDDDESVLAGTFEAQTD